MLLHGDARKLPLRDRCVQTVVTSPPYYGLRDYGVKGQIGLETTPDLYVQELVEVFREVRRVLRDDGTVWLNLGDSYAAGGRGSSDHHREKMGSATAAAQALGSKRASDGYKPKDLVGIPWMVAFALRADGWYLRSDIIWAKPNPMPESVTDRPTRAHEYLFLLTKRSIYYYDHEGSKEPASNTPGGRLTRAKRRALGEVIEDAARKAQQGHAGEGNGLEGFGVPTTRNRRSVWTIPTKPYAGAHFATFPPDLVEPCVRAGSPEGGCCGTCEAPHQRVSETGAPNLAHQLTCGSNGNGEYRGEATKAYASVGAQDPSATKARILAGMVERRTLGWVAPCDCPEPSTIPSLVFDPFGGSGTTVLVAERLGRRGLAMDLNAKYLDLARYRIAGSERESL